MLSSRARSCTHTDTLHTYARTRARSQELERHLHGTDESYDFFEDVVGRFLKGLRRSKIEYVPSCFSTIAEYL